MSETQRRETILRFQIYGVTFVIGFCLAIEDHLLLAVAGFASLAVAHQVLVSWKYWRRRLILFLVTSLVAPQGFTFILRQLGVDISTMSGSSSAVWAVCFLVAIMWFFPGSEE